MTKVDLIIHDPIVAVEFARQIFPSEVRQSMVRRPDFEVFREAVKGLYTSYEIGMRLRVARREIEQRDARIQSLLARTERAENELKKINTSGTHLASEVNPILCGASKSSNFRSCDHRPRHGQHVRNRIGEG